MELWTPSTDLSSRPSGEAAPSRDSSPAILIQNHLSEREEPEMNPGSPCLRHSARDDSLLLRTARELLTTAEILYALPDYPRLLQSYVWQEYDLAPRFPLLTRFLKFWEKDIEGRLHRVTVSVREALSSQPARPAQFTFYADEFGV